jgi:hypothetical protein
MVDNNHNCGVFDRKAIYVLRTLQFHHTFDTTASPLKSNKTTIHLGDSENLDAVEVCSGTAK